MPRQAIPIITSAKSIAALKPRPHRYVARVARVPGLELRVYPDGSKIWSLRYRIHGEQRRLKLGQYDPARLTLAEACKAANRELRKVDAGIDPQAERRATRQAVETAKANSIDALCESYIRRHARPKKRTWREDQSMLKCEVLARWKGRAVTAITRRDCRELVEAIAARPAPIYANRVAALLSRVFRFAVDDEILPANPAARLPKPGVEAQSRPEGEREQKAYDAEEIRAIWTATEALDAAARAQIRLGLVTGQRPREISDMEWRELDGAWWTIPARRTKSNRDHRVFMTPLALDVLKDVPQVEDEPHAFVGHRRPRQLGAVNRRAFADIRRREKPRHALRDSAATGMAAAGVAVEDIAKVLNHSHGPRVTGGYNSYSYDKEKRLALGKWARRLQGILEQKPDAKVVQIAGRA
jgi:integrase